MERLPGSECMLTFTGPIKHHVASHRWEVYVQDDSVCVTLRGDHEYYYCKSNIPVVGKLYGQERGGMNLP